MKIKGEILRPLCRSGWWGRSPSDACCRWNNIIALQDRGNLYAKMFHRTLSLVHVLGEENKERKEAGKGRGGSGFFHGLPRLVCTLFEYYFNNSSYWRWHLVTYRSAESFSEYSGAWTWGRLCRSRGKWRACLHYSYSNQADGMTSIICFGLEWDEEKVIVTICIIDHGIRESLLSSSPNLWLDLFLSIRISIAFTPLSFACRFNMWLADSAF